MSSQTVAVTNQESLSFASRNNCVSDTEETSSSHNQNKSNKHLNLSELYTKESLFNTSITNNSSGLGDSISLPSLSAECSSSNSSIYGGCNTVNAAYSSCSSSESMLETPKSPSSYVGSSYTNSSFLSTNQDASQAPKTISKINNESFAAQKMANITKSVSSECTLNNLNHHLNVLNLNQVDYDPFNDYMGIDKMILQMAGVDAQKAAKGNLNFDPQQQQHIIAQALAAVASSTNANSSSGITNSEVVSHKQSSNRSLTENIELLNSKFMNHKNMHSQNNVNLAGLDKYSERHMDSNSNSLSSLLATVAAHNLQNNNSDSHIGYNSANLPVNLKRQSYPLSSQQHQANQHNFGSVLNNANNLSSANNISLNFGVGSTNQSSQQQSGVNSRLNSTPNLYNPNNSVSSLPNDSTNNRPSNYTQHSEKVNGSISASNSSFNFNLNSSNNEIELQSRNNNSHHHQGTSSANNSSCYEDDEVFSANNSFSTSSLQQNHSNSNNNRHLENSNISPSNNLETQALAQLYRNFLNGNGGNSNNNSASSNNRNTDNISASLNELLASYNANLAALSLNPDLINSSTFLNSTNSMVNQLKTLNNMSNNVSSSSSHQYSNNNSNNNSYSQRQGSANPAYMDQITAAVLKQRQMIQSSRSSSGHISGNPSSNIAALTSATSNIASLLNLNNAGSQNNQQQIFLDSNLKRRSINSTNYGNGAANNNSSPANSTYANASSLFNNSNMGPNASHILQNSSLASSARLNSATSSSAAASVLGNNSSLHSLTSLQHQSSSGLNNHHNLINSTQINSGGNGNNNHSNSQQHQSNLLNFNMSPSSSSNHGILSALSLSSTTSSSLQNQLLSASGKPLRSERLPNHIVEEIVKQAKIRRRNGGKKEVCVFCRNNGEKEQIYTSHTLKDASNHVACPILRLYQCPICHASGDQAHTIKYCPYAEKDSNCIKLFKENGRMSAAAAFLMNSLAGGNTSPSLSPPATPPPSHSTGHSLIHHNNLDIMQSPGQQQNSINAYLNNSLNFNLGSSSFGKTGNEMCTNLNKSFSNCPSSSGPSSLLNSSSTASNTAAANAANSILTSRDSNSSLLSSNFSSSLNK